MGAGKTCGMDALELIQRGYRALGLGADDAVLAMFDQLGRRPACWVVRDFIDSGRDYPSREVVALDLFGGIPPHFEVIGVEPRTWQVRERRARGPHLRRWHRVPAREGPPAGAREAPEAEAGAADGRETRLLVVGRFRARPRGSWDVMVLPFAHIWYLVGGHVVRVVSYLDGVELRRLAPRRD
ncbi:MAG: hypothetical protein WC709_08040 [Thermoleophilia bacterium]